MGVSRDLYQEAEDGKNSCGPVVGTGSATNQYLLASRVMYVINQFRIHNVNTVGS